MTCSMKAKGLVLKKGHENIARGTIVSNRISLPIQHGYLFAAQVESSDNKCANIPACGPKYDEVHARSQISRHWVLRAAHALCIDLAMDTKGTVNPHGFRPLSESETLI